jgi:hypothetical protein
VRVAFERLHQTSKGVLLQRLNIIKHAFAAIGRDRTKLFCGAGVNEDVPTHREVR